MKLLTSLSCLKMTVYNECPIPREHNVAQRSPSRLTCRGVNDSFTFISLGLKERINEFLIEVIEAILRELIDM